MWDERCDVRGEIHEGSRREEEGRQEACGISLRVLAALCESSIQMLRYLDGFCQYICARKCLRESGGSNGGAGALTCQRRIYSLTPRAVKTAHLRTAASSPSLILRNLGLEFCAGK